MSAEARPANEPPINSAMSGLEFVNIAGAEASALAFTTTIARARASNLLKLMLMRTH